MPNQEYEFQLVVIGGGPGGYVAAIKAAQLGKKVALIENRQVGGTCLNRGCIPTKALIHTTQLLQELEHCQQFGITVTPAGYDLQAIHSRKEEVVLKLRTGVEGLLKANKIQLILGTATITKPHCVQVAETTYTAEQILIATGSKPFLPPIPGIALPHVVTSDDLLQQNDLLYKNLVIIGGGVIGVEFASIYQALGCKVTIIEAKERLLPNLDKEISQTLAMSFKKRGITLFTNALVEKLKQGDPGQEEANLLCHFTCKEQSQVVAADGILVAIGRTGNTENLFGSGVAPKMEKDRLVINENFATDYEGIYAIGDVTKDSTQLAHAASAQGVNAVCAIFGQEPPFQLNTVPGCIYTSPEIATVGFNEAQAKAAGIPLNCGKFIMSANGKTLITQGERGFIKILAHAETDVILGAQLLCNRATDMVSELTTAIVNGLTVKQLTSVIHPHPTFAEGIFEALEDVHNQAIHIAPKRQ